ncbi:MAG: YdcF family protein [Methylophaga sp.]|nr:YdcF family protein [Methylophaga sp.]
MDNLFFILSKLAWGLLSPTNLFVLLMALATLQLMRNKISAAKKILLPTAFVSLVLLAYPVSDYLMHPLETRFSKPTELPEKVDGIIMLGGGEELKLSVGWNTIEIGNGGDRFIATAFLAKQYPNVPVIFSGGNGSLRFDTSVTGGDIARELLTTVGIDNSRLIIESKSRNTHENFMLLKDKLPDPAGQYLLVTSAFHMPRSVGIANKQHINVIAYPVDYRSNQPSFRQWGFNLFEHLEVLEPAWREWIGLTVYYWTGKTSEWLPQSEK